MTEVDTTNHDIDIESFVYGLGIAIYDLNKKHNNVLHRTNLGNVMTPFIRFINKVKKDRELQKENECSSEV